MPAAAFASPESSQQRQAQLRTWMAVTDSIHGRRIAGVARGLLLLLVLTSAQEAMAQASTAVMTSGPVPVETEQVPLQVGLQMWQRTSRASRFGCVCCHSSRDAPLFEREARRGVLCPCTCCSRPAFLGCWWQRPRASTRICARSAGLSVVSRCRFSLWGLCGRWCVSMLPGMSTASGCSTRWHRRTRKRKHARAHTRMHTCRLQIG